MGKPIVVLNVTGDTVFPMPLTGTLRSMVAINVDAAPQVVQFFSGETQENAIPKISGADTYRGSKFSLTLPINSIFEKSYDEPVAFGQIVSVVAPANTSLSLFIEPS